MPSARIWRRVPAEGPGIPSLLVSADFTSTSYTIHVTDLANVWTEALDRKPLISRALREDTSIDPTEGPDQIRKLLELLRAAFDVNAPEHGDTSLELSSSPDEENGLVIMVTVILPSGLRPLKWPMHLAKLPHSACTTALVIPLIQAQRRQIDEQAQLISILREKDSIINKVLDKLEATGTRLEHVFGSLAGRKKVTRSAAEDRVQGLAPFEEADFRKNSPDSYNGQVGDIRALLDAVFGNESNMSDRQVGCTLDFDAAADLDDWWTKLSRSKSVTLVERDKPSGVKKTAPSPSPTATVDNKADEDDGFQVQETPPGARLRDGGVIYDSIVVDEDVPDSLPPPAGNIGRKSNDDDDTASSTASENIDDVDGMDLDSAPRQAQGSPANTSPSPRHKQQNRGRGLGRTGGKAKVLAKEAPSSPPSPLSDEGPVDQEESDLKREKADSGIAAAKPKRRLGMIGKMAADTSDGEHAADKGRGKSTTNAKTTPQKDRQPEHRETSVERADRKRAELRADLDKRAGAGPAKKKRKF